MGATDADRKAARRAAAAERERQEAHDAVRQAALDEIDALGTRLRRAIPAALSSLEHRGFAGVEQVIIRVEKRTLLRVKETTAAVGGWLVARTPSAHDVQHAMANGYPHNWER